MTLTSTPCRSLRRSRRDRNNDNVVAAPRKRRHAAATVTVVNWHALATVPLIGMLAVANTTPLNAGQHQGWTSRILIGRQVSDPATTSALHAPQAGVPSASADAGPNTLKIANGLDAGYFLGFQFSDAVHAEVGLTATRFAASLAQRDGTVVARDKLRLTSINLGVNYHIGNEYSGIYFGPFVTGYSSASTNIRPDESSAMDVRGGWTWGGQVGVYIPACFARESAFGIDLSARYTDTRLKLGHQQFSRADVTPWSVMVGLRYSH